MNEDKIPIFNILAQKTPRPEGEPDPDFIKKVDKFVERYYNGDIIINRDVAFSIPITLGEQTSSLGHFLSNSISNYVVAKSKTLEDKYYWASLCIAWITQGFAVGIIREGKGLITKLKECEEGNKQLKKTNEQLEDHLEKLKTKYQNCKEKLETVEERFPQIGDLK